ncbi:unnamed protein product [Protopolystoma xenopodis]|uniref:Uncharacterized protein n=1 Tax=Protopolystoma xenopodis TaxID=117903 RepID=A0A3S5CQW1_9PLAT|nr:unnamed protein product [Protopolystoma xenopodis]
MQRLVVQIYDWDRRCRRQLIWISNEDEAVSRQACLSEGALIFTHYYLGHHYSYCL